MKLRKLIIAIVFSLMMVVSAVPVVAQETSTSQSTIYYIDNIFGNDANSGTAPEQA